MNFGLQARPQDYQQVRGHSAASSTAAKLCLMSNAARGAFKTAMPKATAFLELRQTAVEAEVLGFLCRHALTVEWCKAVDSLDFAKLMQVAA